MGSCTAVEVGPQTTGAGDASLGAHRRWRAPKYVAAGGILALVVVMVLRTGSATRDFVDSFQSFTPGRLAWLALAVGAEAVSLVAYGLAQRQLLAGGGAHLSRRSAAGLGAGSTGIASLVPVGVVPASGWLVAQYRARAVPFELALWTVLAGGFAATVSVLALLLVGAALAGIGPPLLLAGSGAVLVAGSAGFVAAVHRLGRVEAFLARHHWHRGARLLSRPAARAAGVVSYRAGLGGGSVVIGYSVLNWLGDAVCLLAAFGLAGQRVPWTALLFAFAMAQVAGSLSPLPAGIGVVEGGLVGAFSLAGVPVGSAFVATVVYRALGYWAVAGVGSLVVMAMSRRLAAPPAARIADAPASTASGPRPYPVDAGSAAA